MKIGFIGGGRMATALAIGIARNFKDASIAVSDPSPTAVDVFQKAVEDAGGSTKVCESNQQLVDSNPFVFLAVKPQVIESAVADVEIKDSQSVFVSVLAGTTISKLTSLLNSDRIIRAMPNTPCLIGAGAIAVCKSNSIDESSFETVRSIFDQVGTVVEVPERLLDAVTGLSGSGPAFVFTFVEAMTDAGVLAGLPRDIAGSLALQTVLGSAKLIEDSGEHPATLRDNVTSPGGTTIHGMQALENSGFRNSVINAVKAAADRSAELG